MSPRPNNMGASVFEHVRKEAKARARDVQAEAQSYAIRRFIARLMAADTERRTTVKGGQALGLLFGNDRRPTKDLDLNIDCSGVADPDVWIKELIMAACDNTDDGVSFQAEDLIIEQRPHQGLGGYRVSIRSSIHTCRTPFVIDVGVGNQMAFKAVDLTIHEKHPHAPEPADVKVYPIETTFAEKLLSKVEDGASSIRHKDFYDLWYIHDIATRIGDLSYMTAKSLDLDDEELAWRDMAVSKVKDGTYVELPQGPIDEECVNRFAYALYRSSNSRGTDLPASMMDLLRHEFADDDYQSSQFGNWIKNQKQRLINLPRGAGNAAERPLALGMLIDDLEHFIQMISARAAQYAKAFGDSPPEFEETRGFTP